MFSCPARYRKFMEANIALLLAEIGRDVARRADEDPRIQAWATVPNHMIDTDQVGTCAILVGVSDDPSAVGDLALAVAGA